MYDTVFDWYDYWREFPEPVVLPRPTKTLGRKLCGHDTTTPPLDFRSYSDPLFDCKQSVQGIKRVRWSSYCRTKHPVSRSGPKITAKSLS